MTYSQLLHEFLDGTLSNEQQETLFHELARDPELRTEMQQLLRIKHAVQSDTEAFSPPPDAKEAIFAQLGFRTPSQASSANVPPPSPPSVSTPLAPVQALGSGVASNLGRHVLWREIILSSLATSFLTALLFFLFLRPFGNTNNGYAVNGYGGSGYGIVPPLHSQGYTSYGNMNNASFQSKDTIAMLKETIHHYHNRYDNKYDNNHADESRSSMLSREVSDFRAAMAALTSELRTALAEARGEIHHLRAERLSSERYATDAHTSETKTNTIQERSMLDGAAPAQMRETVQLPAVQERVGSKNEWYNNLTIGARGIRSQSLPVSTIASNAERAALSNTAVAALYRISEKEEIGLEGGQEAYFQEFRSFSGEGIPFIIKQNPTLSWLGAAYRYTLFPESFLSPFVHTVLGGADVGLTGRAMLGVRFAPDNRTQFLLGAESSVLLYRHQQTWYATPNIGFSYGVSIRF